MDEQLQAIFHDVFGVAPADFHPKLDADSVEAWDSVMHLTLLLTSSRSSASASSRKSASSSPPWPPSRPR